MGRPVLTEELAQYVLPVVLFDGLCLESLDSRRTADFWSVALGSDVHQVSAGRLRIDPAPGRPSNEILRIDTVRELPRTGDRVHLDLRLAGADPQHLIAAGAQLVDGPDQDPWYVLTDPEGNFFCAYPTADDRPAGIFELVVKSRDAYAQARWWAELLGGEVVAEGEAAAIQATPDFPWDFMVFDPVPEPKVGKNRLHWHVIMRDRNPSALLSRGATVLQHPDTAKSAWVLADPEGNEFCAFPANGDRSV